MTEKRESVIRFRVTESERQKIEDRAIGNVSTWIRDLALDQPPRKPPKPVNPKLLFELNKIGVNLNQITKVINQKGINDQIDLFTILISIDESLKKLREIYS